MIFTSTLAQEVCTPVSAHQPLSGSVYGRVQGPAIFPLIHALLADTALPRLCRLLLHCGVASLLDCKLFIAKLFLQGTGKNMGQSLLFLQQMTIMCIVMRYHWLVVPGGLEY